MILAVVAVIVVAAIYARRTRGIRLCRWRADRNGNKGSLRKYHCATCGAEAFTASKGTPTHCKRQVGKGGL